MIEELKEAYNEMYELTKTECSNCRIPHGCCDDLYGHLAEERIKELGEVAPSKEEGTRCRFLKKDNGCTLQPHQRPLCTLHTCDINSIGYKRNDAKWTNKYFKLRDRIELLEDKRVCGK